MGRLQHRNAARAARMYYLDGAGMDAIANELGTSRSTVSRLITHARQEGIVEIVVHDDESSSTFLEDALHRLYGVRCIVIPNPSRLTGVERLDRVARLAGQQMNAFIDSNMTVGLAWGSTIAAVSRHLSHKRTINTRFVQLNGAGNLLTWGIGYASEILARFARNYGAQGLQFPVPTLFDYATTKEAMWNERSTQRFLEIQRGMDVAIFSIGSPMAEVPSQVYLGGYLSEDDLRELERHHAVGDIATVFFREDGSHEGISVNQRSSGLDLRVLAATPRRVCIVAEPAKAAGVRGALAAGLITDLILDEALARQLIS